MGEVIAKLNLKREKGYLYYLGTDEEGYLLLCKALMRRGGTKKNIK